MQINNSLNSLSQYVKVNSNEENQNSKNQEQNALAQDPAVEVNISKEAKENQILLIKTILKLQLKL